MTTAFDSTLAGLGIGRSGTANPAAAASGKGATQLTQQDFLTLLTAQLKNQDPFDPVDNSQMVAQMAQITTSSGVAESNSTLKAILDKLNGTTTSDALAYVGKTVLTEGSVAYGRSSGGITGAVELDGDATNVTVAITDQNGQILKTVPLGQQAKGTVTFDWDGTTDAGTDAGAGPFKVSFTAQNNGKSVTGRTLVWAPVQSVSTASGSPVLTLPGIGQVPVSAVRQVG